MIAEENKRLDKISLFEGLEPEILKPIEQKCRWCEYNEGDFIFDDKSETIEVYFVVKGMVRAYTGSEENGKDDKEVTFAEFSSGNYFGELAAIDRQPRSAHARAMEPTILGSIDGSDFVELVKNTPLIAFKIVKRLASIIRSMDRRVKELSTLSEPERVYAELARIAMPDPTKPNGRIITIMPKHQDIASWAGTSREVVAQAIGELARNGIVERKSLALLINDWDRLNRLANGSR